MILLVSTMGLIGVFIWWSDASGVLVTLAILATLGVLLWQFYQTAKFWTQTVVDDQSVSN